VWVFQVDLERSSEVQGFVGPHRVVEVEEGLHLLRELRGLPDFQSTEVLALERLGEALHRPVGLGGVVTGEVAG
jgi:hypothetical protein